MNDRIHIEGMGVIGAMLAWHLFERGIDFVWLDNEQTICAWRASTGCIYPSGDSFDMENYQIWEEWEKGNAPFSEKLPGVICRAPYWYSSKAHPHSDYRSLSRRYKGKLGQIREFSGLHLSNMPTLHLNVQSFVGETRCIFQDRRVDRYDGGRKIVAHGFSYRLKQYVWGWSAIARMRYNEAFKENRVTPCFYLRQRNLRYVFAYAYPIPNTPYHYIGSMLRPQKAPMVYEVLPKIEEYKKRIAMICGDTLAVEQVLNVMQGWRPEPISDEEPLVIKRDDVLYVRPMWHSGVRHSPLLIKAVLTELGV